MRTLSHPKIYGYKGQFPDLLADSSEARSEVNQFLADNKLYFEELERILDRPYRQPEFFKGDSPFLFPVIHARALAIRARIRAWKGDEKGAVDDIERAFVVGDCCLSKRNPVVGLDKNLSTSKARGTIPYLLTRIKSKEQVLRLKAIVDNGIAIVTLKQVVEYNLFYTALYARNIDDTSALWPNSNIHPDANMIEPFIFEGPPSNLLINRQYNRILARYIPLWQKSLSEEELEKELKKIMKEVEESHHPDDLLARHILPTAIDANASQVRNAESEFAVLRALLDARLFYLDHQRWPDSLAELAGEYIDIGTKKTVSYKKTSGGCVIWSVGRNGIDEGGERGDYMLSFPPAQRDPKTGKLIIPK